MPESQSALGPCTRRRLGFIHAAVSLPLNLDSASETSALRKVAPADAARPMDVIFIEGYSGQTVIGIHDAELHRPQTIMVDVHAGLPRARACETDRTAAESFDNPLRATAP